ncbi:MAG: hypothetical protein RL754_1391 [Bacteroidota bacterium]
MKKLILIALVTAGLGLKAQYKEIGFASTAQIGLGYGTFYDSNLLFKWGRENRVQRVRLPRTYVTMNQYNGETYTYLNSGLFYGWEWRKPIAKSIQFVRAAELGSFINYGTNYASFTPSMRFYLGLRYQPNERLAINFELPSTISTGFYKANGVWQDNRFFNAGLFNEQSLMSLTYSLEAKK